MVWISDDELNQLREEAKNDEEANGLKEKLREIKFERKLEQEERKLLERELERYKSIKYGGRTVGEWVKERADLEHEFHSAKEKNIVIETENRVKKEYQDIEIKLAEYKSKYELAIEYIGKCEERTKLLIGKLPILDIKNINLKDNETKS